jgi:hypothetical protein
MFEGHWKHVHGWSRHLFSRLIIWPKKASNMITVIRNMAIRTMYAISSALLISSIEIYWSLLCLM